MEQVYEDEYIIMAYEASYSILYYAWKPANINLGNEEYKQECLIALSISENYLPTNVVADLRESEFIISPELQEWLYRTNTLKNIEMGVKRIFVIMKEDFVQQLATEQFIAEDKTKSLLFIYTDSLEDAMIWLDKNA
jgi:hypothetical protein